MSNVLDPEIVTAVTTQVWSDFLGIPLEPAPTPQGEAECAASISIEGAWNGAIIVACSRRLARRAAAVMFHQPEASIDDANWRDTLNEVANILGGNLKSLLPGPSRLGLPEAFDTWQPPPVDPHTLTYLSPEGPLYVSVFPA